MQTTSPRATSHQVRLWRLVLGLVLFGVGIAWMVAADLGLSPWDVLHQGISKRTGIPIGTVGIVVGLLLLSLFRPLGERIGVGTVANVLGIGVVIDLTLLWLRTPEHVAARWALMVGGVLLIGIGSGLYIGAGLGPGPRDGIMTGLARRGINVAAARTGIEVTVLLLGIALGGTAGIGTLAFAMGIGPMVAIWLPRLTMVDALAAADVAGEARADGESVRGGDVAELTFFYGTMNCGKSTLALQMAHNAGEAGKRVRLYTKHSRGGGLITTRIGLERPARIVDVGADLFVEVRDALSDGEPIDLLVCDEAQFYDIEQIDQLARVVDELGVDVLAFGLLTDFTTRQFDGAARLVELADRREELQVEARCWCGARATHNARTIDGVIQRSGATIVVGDLDQLTIDGPGAVAYEVLCRRHHREGMTAVRADHSGVVANARGN